MFCCRVETRLDTVAEGRSVEPRRRHECRRGTQECVRHNITSTLIMDALAGGSHPQGPVQLEGQNGFGRHANRTALGQDLGKRAGASP